MRLAGVVFLSGAAVGIVRRSDVPDSKYVIDAKTHPEVVMVNPSLFNADNGAPPARRRLRARRANSTVGDFNVECGGTMISKKHVITAAHCFEGGRKKGFKVTVNGARKSAVATHFNPDCKFSDILDGPNRCDVGIIELDSDADVTPMPVYKWDDEAGKHLDFYGWGVAGSAATISSNKCDDGAEDAKFRHGENIVAKATAPVEGGGLIEYKMVKGGGGAGALPLEGIMASGDSGSPAYIVRDGVTYIAATDSGSDDNNGCKYGSTDQMCRLSRHYDWIQSVIGGQPTPPAPPQPPTPPAPTPPTPPAPTPPVPPASDLYVCTSGTCTESPKGIPKADCEKGCVAPGPQPPAPMPPQPPAPVPPQPPAPVPPPPVSKKCHKDNTCLKQVSTWCPTSVYPTTLECEACTEVLGSCDTQKIANACCGDRA